MNFSGITDGGLSLRHAALLNRSSQVVTARHPRLLVDYPTEVVYWPPMISRRRVLPTAADSSQMLSAI